jgi:hypothetical protein
MPDREESDLIAKLHRLSSLRAADDPIFPPDPAEPFRADDPAALAALVRGTGPADSALVRDSEARRHLEKNRLRKLLAGRQIDLSALTGDLDPESSEHAVFQVRENRVWKVTRHGLYGLAPSAHFPSEPHTPVEYLDRLALQNAYFEDDIRVLGYGVTPRNELSIVTSQPFVQAMVDAEGNPMQPDTDRDIAPYMLVRGWSPSKHVRIDETWYHPDGLVANDAAARNFILQPDGSVAPIDLMLTRQLER